MMEALETLRKSTGAALCLECGKCTSVCPLAAWGEFSARPFVCQTLEEQLDGGGAAIRRCLTCASCETRCPQGVRFTDLVRGIRELYPGNGTAQDCPHGGALHSVMRLMARGDVKQDRLRWLTDDLKTDPEKGEVFYWTGCTMYFDAFFHDLEAPTLDGTRAAVRLLNKTGVTPVVSPEERCCGHDLLWNGDRESYEMLARHNVNLVAESGAKVLVVSCAECLRTWKVDYQPFFQGKPPRVMHIAEYLADRLPELGLKGNGRRRVTFQDPCRMGRHLEIYEPPRKVLEALPGVELAEMRRSRRSAICCSGGTWAHCDACVKSIQVDRLREARATGAEVLATACPKCRIHLKCAMKDPRLGSDIGIEMRDVAELVAEAIT